MVIIGEPFFWRDIPAIMKCRSVLLDIKGVVSSVFLATPISSIIIKTSHIKMLNFNGPKTNTFGTSSKISRF